MQTGIERIAAERQRQIEAEGWTPEHDDEHAHGEIAHGAHGYLLAACCQLGKPECAPPVHPPFWPWDWRWWKPSNDPIRNLEKAGALVAAEIDRLQRLQTRDS